MRLLNGTFWAALAGIAAACCAGMFIASWGGPGYQAAARKVAPDDESCAIYGALIDSQFMTGAHVVLRPLADMVVQGPFEDVWSEAEEMKAVALTPYARAAKAWQVARFAPPWNIEHCFPPGFPTHEADIDKDPQRELFVFSTVGFDPSGELAYVHAERSYKGCGLGLTHFVRKVRGRWELDRSGKAR